MPKVAVVTGANKGIGFGIVRALCKQFDGVVYLTSRDIQRGEQAVKELQKEGLQPKYHQLDVTEKSSIAKLKQHLEVGYGGLDVLVNNAGISFSPKSQVPFYKQAEETMRINYTGLIAMCDAMYPILKPGARIVHVSGKAATRAMQLVSKERFEKFKMLKTVEDVSEMMDTFLGAAKNDTLQELGWIKNAYGTSKIAVAIVAPIHQEIFNKDISRPDIIVNACCPGHVATDMSDHKGPLTIDEGADTPVFLALLPPGVKSPQGDFLSQRKIYKWRDGNFPPQAVN